MDPSEPESPKIIPLIRRRFLALWLAAVWPYALLGICMISISFVVHAHVTPGPTGSPMEMWHSMSALAKVAIILGFIIQIFLPRDLAAGGVAIIVWSDRHGENLNLMSFLSRFGRVALPLVPLSIGLGMLIFLSGLFILPGIFLAVWSAFVMPALATAGDHAGMAMRKSFRFSLQQIGPLLGLYFGMVIAQIPALLALFIPLALTSGRSAWWAGMFLGWGLFAVLMGLIFMTQSVILATLYLDAVRSSEAFQAQQLSQ